jgi:hypothetical protein
MPSRESFAYRRALKMRATRAVQEGSSVLDNVFVRAQNDFLTFCTLLDKAPAHHMLEWHKHLITGESNRYLLNIAGPNLDILAPRGSAKSTVLNMFTAWCIGRHTAAQRPLQIIYVSYNIATAIPKSRIIRQIVDSPEFMKVFPTCRLKPGMQSDIGWAIDFDYAGIPRIGDEEFTLRAAGLRGSITSKRAHLCIVDDPVKSSADIKNPSIRDEMNNNWSSVIAPIIFEGGRAICLGTRFHPLDIHKTMFVPQKGWKQVSQEALSYDNDGEPVSYWPEQWSVDYLLQQKELDPVAFAFQYQQQPVMTSDLVLSPDLIVKGEVATEFDSLAVGIDLSASKNETSDYTAFVMGGRLKDTYYIIEYRKFDALVDQLINIGATSHDDLLDSYTWLMTFLQRRGNFTIEY